GYAIVSHYPLRNAVERTGRNLIQVNPTYYFGIEEFLDDKASTDIVPPADDSRVQFLSSLLRECRRDDCRRCYAINEDQLKRPKGQRSGLSSSWSCDELQRFIGRSGDSGLLVGVRI